MLVSPDKIAPSQDFLKAETIRHIFRCIQEDTPDKLPPPPIVRKDAHGQLIAIDGHNLLAVRSYLGEVTDVHVATSASDGIPEITAADATRNAELKEKYERVLSDQAAVQALGITSFADLISKYELLFVAST